MRRPFLFGIIMLMFFLTSCNSLEDIDNNVSELNNNEVLNTRAKGTEEDLINHEVVAHEEVKSTENSEERIVEEVPSELNGSIEDESIRVSIHAEIEVDKMHYKTNIIFSNKSDKSLDLFYDCGLLISNDNFASNKGDCPAVESMLLKKNNKERQTVILPKDFYNRDNKIITIRYRQDKITNELKMKLKAKMN